jgi:hypothetical protein
MLTSFYLMRHGMLCLRFSNKLCKRRQIRIDKVEQNVSYKEIFQDQGIHVEFN